MFTKSRGDLYGHVMLIQLVELLASGSGSTSLLNQLGALAVQHSSLGSILKGKDDLKIEDDLRNEDNL